MKLVSSKLSPPVGKVLRVELELTEQEWAYIARWRETSSTLKEVADEIVAAGKQQGMDPNYGF